VYNIKALLEHANSRTFQGLSRAWDFLFKIQGLLKDPMNPEYQFLWALCQDPTGVVQGQPL